MALPTTITLNVGSPAADVVFTSGGAEGDEHLFYAPSPQSDLQGRPSIRFSHELTKNGIRRSLRSVAYPEYDSSLGVYVGVVKDNGVTTRRDAASLALVDTVLEMSQELLAVANVRDAIGQALV